MWLVDTLTCLLTSCSPTNIRERPVTTMAVKVDNYVDKLPVVCWHGINDDARSCDMIFATLNNTQTLSIQIGDTLEADKYNSVFMAMIDQVTEKITRLSVTVISRFITAVNSLELIPVSGLVTTQWACHRAGSY